MSITAKLAHEYRNGKYKVMIHEDQMLNRQAEFALSLLKHLAVIAAAPDGVDDAGRQALRLMKPGEIAERACEIADEAFKQIEARDWIIPLPSAEEFWKANGVTDDVVDDED